MQLQKCLIIKNMLSCLNGQMGQPKTGICHGLSAVIRQLDECRIWQIRMIKCN